MARQVIDTTTNNGTYIGDPAKTAFEKTNANFAEIYSITVQLTGDQVISGNKSFTDRIRVGNVNSAPTEIITGYTASGTNNAISTVIGIHDDRSDALASIGVSRGGASALIGIAFATSSGSGPVYRWEINSAGNLLPVTDNTVSVGASGRRPTVLWAVTGTISTSDATKKTEVFRFNENELACALALADEIGWFKWLDSIEEKGSAARRHVGQTVQRAISIMEAYGLNPFEWGFICMDEWEDDSCVGEDGSSIRDTSSGVIYSFRMDQLYAFIVAGIRFNQSRIEQRLSSLESSFSK